MTRRAFANILNIQENTLRNYEKGLSLPNSNIISKICTSFNVSPAWLLFGYDESASLNIHQKASSLLTLDAQHTETIEQNTCKRCVKLEKELDEERAERRELTRENRQLWKENSALREELAVLKTSSAKNMDIEERRIA